MSENIFRSYVLDYIGKYHFYEEEEFIEVIEEGEYILENLKKSGRFDYKGSSYRFTKYGNISEGTTQRDVVMNIAENDINVTLDNEPTHLDLIYKMEVKKLEDHYRVATRITEKSEHVSTLIYIDLRNGEDCIKALEEVKKYQESLFNKDR
ncbi:MAG: hypothetical protein ACI398_03620 [Clostridium sp.]